MSNSNPKKEGVGRGNGGSAEAGLEPGKKFGEECVLGSPLDWPWLMEVWLVRINGDDTASVAGIIPPSIGSESGVYAELKAATRRVEKLRHPGILPVQRWVEAAGRAAIISGHEAAQGLPQLAQAQERGFFEVAEIKEWVAQLCRALDDAHGAGLIHGWLSVHDLLVTAESDVLIANFGVTRMLAAAGLADERALAAASPQAMGGEVPSVADDVYGLGAVIFQLVTGSPIFEGPNVSQKVLEQVPPTMQVRREQSGKVGWEIPTHWEQVVAACLAKDAAQRPKRARDVGRLLGLGLPAQPLAPLDGHTPLIVGTEILATAHKTLSTAETPGQRLLEPFSPAKKSPAGKWAWAALLIAILGIAWALSRRSAEVEAAAAGVKPTASPVASAAPVAPELAPVPIIEDRALLAETPAATPTATATPTPPVAPTAAIAPVTPSPTASPSPSVSPAGSVAVLPENLPSLESLAQEPPLPTGPAPVASPSASVADLAFNRPPAGTPGISPAASPLATATPAASPSDAMFTNSLGMKFVPVGDVKFSIWETRLEDFAAFAKATNTRSTQWKQPGFPQGSNHPVVYASWDDAMAFCRWLTQKDLDAGLIKTSEVYRLPTDLEWSKAAGLPAELGESAEMRDMGVPEVYPWGTQWPPPAGSGNYTGEETGSDVAIRGYNDGFNYTAPVGSFRPNSAGLYDMGGNTWEWCMDFWNDSRKYRVLRGGSWYNGALKLSLLSSCRVNAQQESSTDNFGFRVVLAPINSLPASGR